MAEMLENKGITCERKSIYSDIALLIENGYVYIAQPPLFKVTQGKVSEYLYDEHALDKMLKEANVDVWLDTVIINARIAESNARRVLCAFFIVVLLDVKNL